MIFVEDAACTFLCFALVLAGRIQVITRECLSFHIQGMGNTFPALQSLKRTHAGNYWRWLERHDAFRWYPPIQLFLPISCSFALPIFGISDRATEVIPASRAVTDMVTYSRLTLTLQDIIAPKAPAFSSTHLWNLAASYMTPQRRTVRPSQPLWSCCDFCEPPTLLLVTAETCTSSSSNWRTTGVGSSDTGPVLLEKGRTSLLPCFWGGEVCRFGRCRHFLHGEKKWKRWNQEFWAPPGHPSHSDLVLRTR